MISQFVSFSAINFLSGVFNYLFQYFASLKLDQMNFSLLMALLSVVKFFTIVSSLFRSQFAMLFADSNFNFSSRLKKRYQKIIISVLMGTVLLVITAAVFKRDQFNLWPILLTGGVIFFSISFDPLKGLLQAKKEFNRIAFFSLTGSTLKLLIGAGILLMSSFKAGPEVFLSTILLSVLLVYFLFFKASTQFPSTEENFAQEKNSDRSFALSALGTLSIATINVFDAILFIQVLSAQDSAHFGKYILIGRMILGAFEILIFTLFPYFLEQQKFRLKTMMNFLGLSAFLYFLMDLIPVSFLNYFFTKLYKIISFDPLLFQQYWKQIIVTGLSSILLSYVMARKKLVPLLFFFTAAIGLSLYILLSHPDNLQEYVLRNKMIMESYFLALACTALYSANH